PAAAPAPPADREAEPPPAWADAPADDAPAAPPAAPPSAAEPAADRPRDGQPDPSGIAAARGAIATTRAAGAGAPVADSRAEIDAEAHPDDPDVESSGLVGAELLERELGARVIEEIPHQ
ncbi:DNA polymerase III subunit gamma/tau, partial [Nocardioides sp. GCM10027114]